MTQNPVMRLVVIVATIVLLLAMGAVVLPVVGAIFLGLFALVALISFSGWLVRLIKGDAGGSQGNNGGESWEQTSHRRPKLPSKWGQQQVEDGEIVDEIRRK